MPEVRAFRLVIVAVCVLAAALAGGCRSTQKPNATSLIQLEEHDLDGGRAQVPDRLGIVDINSKLAVTLDVPGMAETLRHTVGPGGPSRVTLAELKNITTALQKASDRLPNIRDALKQWDASNKADIDNRALGEAFGKFGAEMDPIDSVVRGSPELRTAFDRRVEEVVDADPNASQTEQDRIVLELVNDWLQGRRAEVEQQAAQSGGYLRLGAWLDRDGERSPVHLPGFDTVPEGEFYEVERWKIALTADQRAQLEQRRAEARAINAPNGDSKVLFDRWAVRVRAQVQELLSTCIEEFQTRTDTFASSQAPALAAALRLNGETKDIVRLANRLREKYGQVKLPGLTAEGWLDLLHGLHEDFEELVTQWRELRAAFKDFRAAAADVPQAAKAAFDELVAGECITAIDSRLQAMAQELGVARASADVEEFSDAVLKLDLLAVPNSTELDLRRTGLREAGDQVLMRMAVGKRTQDGAKPAEQTVATRELDLQRVLPHLETTVGLIFANPDGSSELSSDFQAAPAYSILYKEGSRSSRLRNALFDWGVGLNVAALDFDKDDTPELGFGVVAAALRNHVQVGYGYNPFEDKGYWFFSISLPFQTWSLGGESDSGK